MQPKGSFADEIIATIGKGGRRVEPSFADPADRSKVGTWARDAVLGARRFYLDDEVTAAAATLGVQHPDLLLQMLPRARSPFPRIWLEWSVPVVIRTAGQTPAPDVLDRAGVIIEALDSEKPIYRLTQINMTGGDEPQHVHVCEFSIVYNLTDPTFIPVGTNDQDLIGRSAGFAPDMMRKTLVASAYRGVVSDDAEEQAVEEAAIAHRLEVCDRLTEHARYTFSRAMGPVIKGVLTNTWKPKTFGHISKQDCELNRQQVCQALRSALLENAGAWRTALAALALINAQDMVESEIVGRAGHQRSVGGKVLPYLEYRTVSLKLPRKVVLGKIIRSLADAIPRRRHDVIGHWKQSRKKADPNCEHVFIPIDDRREECACCPAKRWWQANSERGDASIGYVVKNRRVTT